jgi:hypothetical protein
MGNDISQGVAGSNSVCAVMDRETGEIVAEYIDPHIAPEELADLNCEVGKHVFHGQRGSAHIVWEANGPGEGWFRHLLRNNYTNIYYQRREGSKGERKGRKYGWHSSRGMKADRLGDLRAGMVDLKSQKRRIIIRSVAGLDEMGRYVYMEDGSIGPDTQIDVTSGARAAHGDRVIAYMLCLMAKTEASRFKKPKSKPIPGSVAERFKMDRFINLDNYQKKAIVA